MVTVLLVSATGAVFAEDDPIDMVVSPNFLNVASNSLYIHIHTDIGYDDDAVATVEVNENVIASDEITTFEDDCGNLVVMFDIDLVKGIVDNPEIDSADFVLTYLGREGEDSIDVIRTPKNP